MALATFKTGGVHPPDKKELSKDARIVAAKPPVRVIIPMSQHIGAPCKPTVQIGQEVKIGEVVGSAEAFVSAPVHSSVSGKVISIGGMFGVAPTYLNSTRRNAMAVRHFSRT